MNFIMEYNGYTIDNPAITAMPKFIYLIIDTLGGPIKLYTKDNVSDEDFRSNIVKPIRREMRKWGYRVVTATKDNEVVNPVMMHIPSKQNSTIKFSEYENFIFVEKADIDEAINRMSENDITVNEVLDDVIGIRQYNSYKNRLKYLKHIVREAKQEINRIETRSVKELLNI